jgi:hypothetical protein
MRFVGVVAVVIRDSRWHRLVQWILPYYHEDEVEARHQQGQAVMTEAVHSMERAAAVTTGVRREAIRRAYTAIADRLDGH